MEKGWGRGRAVTSLSLSGIRRISRFLPSSRKPLRPSPLSRIPDSEFSPILHSAFCILHSLCIDMRPPSSHKLRAAPNPRWAIWRKKMKKVRLTAGNADERRSEPGEKLEPNGARLWATPQPQPLREAKGPIQARHDPAIRALNSRGSIRKSAFGEELVLVKAPFLSSCIPNSPFQQSAFRIWWVPCVSHPRL